LANERKNGEEFVLWKFRLKPGASRW